jgi:hypothetical protein
VTCSKLSSTSSERRSPKKRTSAAGVVSVSPTGAPTADAMAGATSSAFATADRSTNRPPSGKPSATAAAAAIASRVLPTPPGPTSVITRAAGATSSTCNRATSSSRP